MAALLELGAVKVVQSLHSRRSIAARRMRRLAAVPAAAAAAAETAAAAGGLILTNAGSMLQATLANEPRNALSLPTWTIHVASVVEWVAAMILVWRYGDTKSNAAWKGLTWGMVPSLGGALCACTWHFFYNAESLEILVVLQSALTLIGSLTLWIASFRIYQAVQRDLSA